MKRYQNRMLAAAFSLAGIAGCAPRMAAPQHEINLNNCQQFDYEPAQGKKKAVLRLSRNEACASADTIRRIAEISSVREADGSISVDSTTGALLIEWLIQANPEAKKFFDGMKTFNLTSNDLYLIIEAATQEDENVVCRRVADTSTVPAAQGSAMRCSIVQPPAPKTP